MSDKYQAEVIDPGDKASIMAKDVCVASYGNNRAVKVIPRQPNNFRGAVDLAWTTRVLLSMLRDGVTWTVQNDGAGGKPQFFTIIGTDEVFERLGWEIVVMVIDDIARSGGFPVVFSNDVNAKKVTKDNFHLVEAMLKGLGEILKQTNQVNVTGEFAIMKNSVTAFCDRNSDEQLIVNWAGTGIGLSHFSRVIDGRRIQPGMPIVGFWEPGYRCNGGTQLTDIVTSMWAKGDIRNIWDNPEAMEFITKLTVPSMSYAKTICRLNGWNNEGLLNRPLAKLAGVAHLTGGGVKKFKEMLPPGIGAELHSMPRPADVLLQAQDYSQRFPELKMSDSQCHTTFHGGCGEFVVGVDGGDMEKIIAEAGKDGIKAFHIGETTVSEKNEVLIHSKFLEGGLVSI